MEPKSYEPGTPSWVDLSTSDIDGAAAFYTGLFGWTVQAGVEEAGGYRIAEMRGLAVAGMGPATNPGPPAWTTYISVKSADATAAKMRDAGATLFMDPMDVMDVGRMTVAMDPTGAAIAIWEPRAHIGAYIVNEPGALCWNELNTRDVPAATKFYSEVFGWTAATQDGPMPYTEWELNGQTIGGMMPMPEAVPAQVPAYWLAYFAVDDCDGSAEKATKLGGSVMVPPMDIPAGRFAVAMDPAGAMFGLIKLSS